MAASYTVIMACHWLICRLVLEVALVLFYQSIQTPEIIKYIDSILFLSRSGIIAVKQYIQWIKI